MIDTNVLKNALNELAAFIKETVAERVQKYGKNRKGVNTLVNSDLIKDMKVSVSENSVGLIIADYWTYVSTGWKFNNFESGIVGLRGALVKWALKKITSNNVEAWDIAERIYFLMIKKERPIPPRPFMVYSDEGDLEEMIPELKSYMDKWFDELLALQEKIAEKNTEKYIGKTYRVLCDEIVADGVLSGHTNGTAAIRFEGDEKLLGEFVNVKVVSATNSLNGVIID